MQKKLKRVVLTFGTLTFICAQQQPLMAQQKDTLLNEIVVSASRSRSVTKQSAPVQSLSKSKMEKLGMQELYEAVRSFSGASIKDYGGIGGVKTVSVRSLGAQHTAVSYDGVTISNTQGGQVDIGAFSLDNVEEVSLTIGQGDNIFQAARNFASSGILNIKSSAPKFLEDKRVNVGVQLKGGSFGMFNPMANLEGKISERWQVAVRGDWMRADGEYPYTLVNGNLVTEEIRKNSDVNTLKGELNLYGAVGKSGKIAIKANYLDSERGLPGSVILYNNKAEQRLWDKNGFAQIGYSNDFNQKWSLESKLKYTYNWNRYIDIDNKYVGGMQDDRYTQQEYYASAALRFRPSKFWNFTFSQDVFENILRSGIPECIDPNRISSMSALAGQYINDRLTVTASLLGVYNTEWVNKEGNAAPDREHLSPSLSLSYKLSKKQDIRVRASVKDSYRIPTFNDLYYARIGNSNLKPERATQYNLGFTYNGKLLESILDNVLFSVDGYYNSVKDKIVAIPTMFIWRMLNMGEVDILGADVNLGTSFSLSKHFMFNLSGNYSYQYAVDITDPTAKNYKHQIPYTPRHSGNVALTSINKWVDVGYTLAIVGDRYSLAQNIPSNLIKGYVEQNISLSHTFNIKETTLRLQGEVLNLGNAMYDVIRYYPMPGRQFRISVKYNF